MACASIVLLALTLQTFADARPRHGYRGLKKQVHTFRIANVSKQRGHPVESWEPRWVSGEFPGCVPCHGVPDGPLAANGDLGVVLGGRPGNAFDIHGKPLPGSLGFYLGKNDFWGWPGAVTYHASFQHFSVGYLLLDLESHGHAVNLTNFTASQRLADALLRAGVSTPGAPLENRYALSVSAVVLSSRNVVLANVTASCPAGIDTVQMKMTLASDNFFGMPLEFSASSDGSLILQKSSVRNNGSHTPVLTPCSHKQIVYNGLRTFAVGRDSLISVVNGTRRNHCLRLTGSDRVVTSSDCADTNLTGWKLVDGNIKLPAMEVCLGVRAALGAGHHVKCPPLSYYTDASPDGACQSMNWTLLAVKCDDARASIKWTYNSSSGFLRSSVGKCLTAVVQSLSNNVAAVVKLLTTGSDPKFSDLKFSEQALNHSTVRTPLQCGQPMQLTISVASQRDTDWVGNELEIARERATIEREEVPGLMIAHQKWWSEFWGRSFVDLGGPAGPWPELEFYYYSMMYLMRGSMRQGKVTPGLWGPFSTTDFPAWSDDLTLDYNLMANFWSAATSNHAELIELYASTILDSRLVPLAKQRAALSDWSLGGWPDQFGAEVMGMSCGPTPNWDHDFGCKPGFGGFKGLAFVSCTGPFDGMACCFDDGTRFVAGLVATPLLQYYDATQSEEFLHNRLLPYLRGVADFYSSYAVLNSSTGHYDIPFTCSQETCAGLIPTAAEHNAHQDLAYARMVFSRLLDLTDPKGQHQAAATTTQRVKWMDMLSHLAPFPLVDSKLGPVFAEAVTSTEPQPAPDSNADYPIVHFAAMHPAAVIGPDSADDLQTVAWNTMLLNNMATDFGGSSGPVLSWPSASRLAQRKDARALLSNFTRAFNRQVLPNGWPNDGGGGLESIGGLEALHLLMLRGDDALRIFPAWPEGAPARFQDLRAPGAFLVSAQWDGAQVVAPVSLTSLVGRTLVLESPWPGWSLCAITGRSPPMHLTPLGDWPDRYRLKTEEGVRYDLQPCNSSAVSIEYV